MKTSPTQRSLKLMRDRGFICQVVEKWNPFAKIRQDLMGWVDIVCISEHGIILGVQTTTYKNIQARIKKAKGNEALRRWLINNALVAHGWKKVTGHWVAVEVPLSGEMV